MMTNTYTKETKREIKLFLTQLKQLERTLIDIMQEENVHIMNKYVSYKEYIRIYNDIVTILKEKELITGVFYTYNDIDSIPYAADMLPFQQKILMEGLLINIRLTISSLESNIDFVDDEINGLANFIQTNLRATFEKEPVDEKEVQHHLEILFLGNNLKKGIDFERESGKFSFSGKEYIPDFIFKKYKMCLEVKTTKKNSKSKIIEEINADINAYKKKYDTLMFIIYDFSKITNENEFKSDLESSGNVKVIIIKH